MGLTIATHPVFPLETHTSFETMTKGTIKTAYLSHLDTVLEPVPPAAGHSLFYCSTSKGYPLLSGKECEASNLVTCLQAPSSFPPQPASNPNRLVLSPHNRCTGKPQTRASSISVTSEYHSVGRKDLPGAKLTSLVRDQGTLGAILCTLDGPA